MTTMLRLIVQRHWRQHQPSLRGLFKECNGRQPYLNEQVCLHAACQYIATNGNFLGRATGSRHAGVACCGQSVVSLQQCCVPCSILKLSSHARGLRGVHRTAAFPSC